MQSYLILSQAYYGTLDSNAPYRLIKTLTKIHHALDSKKQKIDFAAFRYDNKAILNPLEYALLFAFLDFCRTHNIVPLLNLSLYKIETFLLLWLHGFYMGMHFKESDITLLQNNICPALMQIMQNMPLIDSNNMAQPCDILEDITHSIQPQCALLADRIQNLLHKNNLTKMLSVLQNTLFSYYKADTFAGISKTCKQYPFFVSAHSLDDLKQAFALGANYATISPIFYDKGNKAVGLPFLHALPLSLKKATFALGGITNDERIAQIESLGMRGFASISYFLRL